jgi:hypothetical protein
MKKIIFLTILSTIIFARSNPFEPTQQYTTQYDMARQLQQTQHSPVRQQHAVTAKQQQYHPAQQHTVATQQQQYHPAQLSIEPVQQTAQDDTEATNNQPVQLQPQPKPQPKRKIQIQSAQELAKDNKKIYNNTPLSKIEPIVKESFRLLPFIKVYIVNNILTLRVDPKYKLINKEIIPDENKVFFDFKGKKSFYTKKRRIISDDYEYIVAGTHLKQKYFRVVIKASCNILSYRIKIDKKHSRIIIKK